MMHDKEGKSFMSKIGLQLYTLREAATSNFHNLLIDVGAIGYEGVQFAGFYDTPAEKVNSTLVRSEMIPAGAHVPIDQLQENLDSVKQFHESINNSLIICPYLPEEMRQTKEDYLKSAELFNQIGKKLKDSGFQFAYHNHAFEFEEMENETGFSLLFGNTDSELVKMELDCYWATYAKYDPIKIINKYKDRCISLHIKDIKLENGEKVSTEIGNGRLDVRSLIQTGIKNNVEWFIVEQEHFTGDPLKSAEKNLSALKDML